MLVGRDFYFNNQYIFLVKNCFLSDKILLWVYLHNQYLQSELNL